MKSVQDMTVDELKEFLRRRGFQNDEIEVSFKTEFDLREAVKDMRKLSSDDDEQEETQGWDKEDDTELSRDEQLIVENRKKQKEARLKRLKELKAQKGEVELGQSIDSAGKKVTPAEVKSSMEDIAKLLGGE